MSISSGAKIQKLIYPTLLFIITNILWLTTSAVPTVPYTYPSIVLDPNATILANTSLTGNISKLLATDSYIITNSVNGSITVWDIQTHQLLFSIFAGAPIQPTEVCTHFDFSQNGQTLAVTTLSKKVIIFTIVNNTLTLTSTFNLIFTTIQDIQIGQSEIVILQTAGNSVTYVNRFDFAGVSLSYWGDQVVVSPTVYTIKTCQPVSNPNFYYIVAWKNDCFFQIFTCPVGSNCTSPYNFQSMNCAGADWVITAIQNYEIEFSQDCSQMIFHEKTVGTRIFDMNLQQFQTNYTSTVAQNLTEMVFLDSSNLFIGSTATDGTYSVYQYQPTVSGSLVNVTIPNFGLLFDYNFYNKRLISATGDTIYSYVQTCPNVSMTLSAEGYCILCPVYCSSCDYNGVCLTCQINYTLVTSNNTCSPPIVPPANTTNTTTTNTTTNGTTTNNTTTNNTTTNNTTNITNNTVPSPTTPNDTMSYEDSVVINPIYPYEEQIGGMSNSQMARGIINVSALFIGILQIFPFSFLFMKFINFWSICSFYLLLGTRLPKYFYEALTLIYQGINASIFQIIGIDVKLNLNLQEKVTGFLNDQYGISSDFVNSNLENFSILLLSYLILALIYAIQKSLSKNNPICKALSKINYPMAIVGQYVAIMNGFFLNILTIQCHSVQPSFNQKINMSLHVFFMILSLAIVGYTLDFNQNPLSHNKQAKEQLRMEQKQKRDWLINCLCNSIIPALVVYDNLTLYFVFNAGLFVFCIYSAFKEPEFKVNSILLSLQLMLFHIGFVVLTIFDSQKYPEIYHMTGSCLVIVLFCGAIHQLISLFFSIVYQILCTIKHYLTSVASEPQLLKSCAQGQTKQIKINIVSDKLETFDTTKTTLKNHHFLSSNLFISKFKSQEIINSFEYRFQKSFPSNQQLFKSGRKKKIDKNQKQNKYNMAKLKGTRDSIALKISSSNFSKQEVDHQIQSL